MKIELLKEINYIDDLNLRYNMIYFNLINIKIILLIFVEIYKF